jgi:arylsulfatase A-like enzyme
MRHTLPDIIFITADSLRADMIASTGESTGLSPNLDDLATRSSVFTMACSSGPNTPHAFPAIMSGYNALAFNKLGLFECETTLAESLSGQGYHTVAFNAGNPYLSRFFHYDRGFDHFVDFMDYEIDFSENTGIADHISIPVADIDFYLLTEETVRRKMELEQNFNSRVIAALTECDSQPLFLWVHYMDSHYPYVPAHTYQKRLLGDEFGSEEVLFLNQHVRQNTTVSAETLQRIHSLYRAAVLQLDNRIGELLHALQQVDRYESALVTFCSDHGEEFQEHGDLQHKSKMFNELLHIPLLVKRPRQQSGERLSKPVSLRQIATTIVEFAGVEGVFPGVNLWNSDSGDVLAGACYGGDGGTPTDQQMFRIAEIPKRACLIEGHWKLMLDTADQRCILFNQLTDPEEQTDLSGTHEDISAALMKQLFDRLNVLEQHRIHLKSRKVVEQITRT